MNDYQKFIALSRYARWLPEEKRREHWSETVARYFDFFTNHLKEIHEYDLTSNDREVLEVAINNLDVMPSMRCMMTAGDALKKNNIAGYNCSYVAIDHPKAFDEILFILMHGTGVGFSVERQFIQKLHEIPELELTGSVIQVADSKEGWQKGLRRLFQHLWDGEIPTWDLSKIREKGARLKTFGGRASGPQPLEDLFQFTVQMFKGAQNRKLTSVECHRIACKIAEVVVVGGVRRSALISLSNLSDERMRHAKSGQWWVDTPEMGLANNSVCYTEKPDIGIFMIEWTSLYESKSGERGIFNREAAYKHLPARRREQYDGKDLPLYGTNPCSEIVLQDGQFCNLSEVVLRTNDTLDDIRSKVKLAAILGTMQATLTNIKGLRAKWKQATVEEALLGVSLTGIMDHTFMNGSKKTVEGLSLPDFLSEIKDIAVSVNEEWANKFGINPAMAATAIKPSGCTTLNTKIKTTSGDMSMADIFIANKVEDVFSLKPNTWIEPIIDVKVYDENNDEQLITKLFINGLSDVYEVEFNNEKYKFTGNHKLKTVDGWKRVDEITIDDDVIQL
jgi:ribonucleoside-diphosphate reductase alpha chain